MAEDDKYPTESGRRRFVKGVVGSATLASAGTGAAAAIGTATSSSGAGGGITQFVGIENTDGPAPRGMPIIPIQIDGEGYLKGLFPEPETKTVEGREITVAETDVGGMTYSSTWFQYCGVQTYPGVRPGAEQDNFFRSAGSSAPYEWQGDQEQGQKLHVDDFTDYEEWGNNIGESGLGKPAMTNWRSVDVSPQETMPVQVLRSTRVEEYDGPNAEFFNAATQDGFMAWLDKCTHFCCVPAYKAYEGSAKFGAEDAVYCQCHQSVYRPMNPVSKSFVALPRPEE